MITGYNVGKEKCSELGKCPTAEKHSVDFVKS
jgi:hypothetical protein